MEQMKLHFFVLFFPLYCRRLFFTPSCRFVASFWPQLPSHISRIN